MSTETTNTSTIETPSTSSDNTQALTPTPDLASWFNQSFDSLDKVADASFWGNAEETEETEETATEDKPEEPTADTEDTEAKTEEKESTEEEKPTEESAEEDEDTDTKSMTGSAGAKFKELKTELKTYKSKVAEMEKALAEREAKLSEIGQSPESISQMEEMKTRLAEYEQEISVSRIEASPQYKQAVLEPTQSILDSAVSLAERYEVAPKKLIEALRQESTGESSEALTELAADFNERDRIRLYGMADDLTEVSKRRDYLRDNASKALSELQQKQQAQEAEEEKWYKEESAKIATQTWDTTFANNPSISSLGDEVIKEAQSAGGEVDLLESSADERAYAVYAGVVLPHLAKKYEEVSGKLAEMEKALSKYKKASPKASGNTDTSPQKQEIGGFLDAIEKRFNF
jgi:hypothetical protein